MLHNCGTAAHTPCRKAGEQDACTARLAPGVEPLLGGTGGGASGVGAAGGRYRAAQRQQLSRQLRQAARSQQGIAVQLPRESDRLTVLVCTAGEQPGFVLAYLNASQNGVHLLAVPAGLQVTFADEDAALADCYTAAGPARCRQALMECLPLPEDTRYLALSEAVLERITARYGPVRVGFSGAMTAGELARYGRDSRVQGLSAAEAHGFLTGMDADAVVPQAHRAAARGAQQGEEGRSRPWCCD